MSMRVTAPGARPGTVRAWAAVIALAISLVMTATGLGLPTSAAYATSNGFWSLTPPPLPNGTVPDAVALELAPGSVTSVPVVVTNKTDSPLTIKSANQLSPVVTDASVNGVIDSNEITKWATITNSEVTTAARKSQVLTVRFRIPTSAKSGDYAGQLVTFGAPVTIATTGFKQDRSLTLRFTVRVTGGIKPAVELSTLDVKDELLFFRLTNSGNTLLQPKVSLQGLATDGSKISVLDVPIGELFPGESRAIQSPLGTTPRVLKVTATIEGGEATSEWPQTPVGAAVVSPGEVPPPPPNPGSTTASLIVFALIALFVIILIWWAAATRSARKRAALERRALIEGARQAEVRGEAAAAAAVAATAPSMGQPFPPPAGAPIPAAPDAGASPSTLTLAAVAAGVATVAPLTPGRPAEPPAPPAPAGPAPFPPPTGPPVAATPSTQTTAPPTAAPPAEGVPFPPPNGAPIG